MPTAPKKAKTRAPRNRTIELAPDELSDLRSRLSFAPDASSHLGIRNQVICGDTFSVLVKLPGSRIDLLFADPPYNLRRIFGEEVFSEVPPDEYEAWLESWLILCIPLLKPTASIYICGDWRSSSAIQRVGSRYFKLQNRITWEREKGRGAKKNWKNTAEDIWYFTVSDKFSFNLDSVKVRRKVLAPYKSDGKPKDWNQGEGGNYRDTHPSNIWTDISVPFWSMPENTDHPTQKPEKLLAKIILASTDPGDMILDPFAGSGTAAVVAKKLGRGFVAIESDEQYCLLAQKRLDTAEFDKAIQGFSGGVFWERNAKIT